MGCQIRGGSTGAGHRDALAKAPMAVSPGTAPRFGVWRCKRGRQIAMCLGSRGLLDSSTVRDTVRT